MTSRIHIDTNIPIYARGREHPLRGPSRRVISLIAGHPETFATNVGVLQELMHRYMALHEWPAGRAVFEDFINLMWGQIESILPEDAERAATMAGVYSRLSARDLIHLAVMFRVGATHIVSADRGFDQIDGVTRLDPLRVEEWEPLVAGGG